MLGEAGWRKTPAVRGSGGCDQLCDEIQCSDFDRQSIGSILNNGGQQRADHSCCITLSVLYGQWGGLGSSILRARPYEIHLLGQDTIKDLCFAKQGFNKVVHCH